MLKAERLQAIVDITNKEKIVTSEELIERGGDLCPAFI